jgi:hypothetical protein
MLIFSLKNHPHFIIVKINNKNRKLNTQVKKKKNTNDE